MNNQNNVTFTMQDLEVMKNDIEKGKALYGKAEGKLEGLEQQRVEMIKQVESLGVKPEELKTEIQNIASEIKSLYVETKGLIPTDILSESV